MKVPPKRKTGSFCCAQNSPFNSWDWGIYQQPVDCQQLLLNLQFKEPLSLPAAALAFTIPIGLKFPILLSGFCLQLFRVSRP